MSLDIAGTIVSVPATFRPCYPGTGRDGFLNRERSPGLASAAPAKGEGSPTLFYDCYVAGESRAVIGGSPDKCPNPFGGHS